MSADRRADPGVLLPGQEVGLTVRRSLARSAGRGFAVHTVEDGPLSHVHASTVTSSVDFAWQAKTIPFSSSPGCNPSFTSMVTWPAVFLTRQTPQTPTRQE